MVELKKGTVELKKRMVELLVERLAAPLAESHMPGRSLRRLMNRSPQTLA